MRTLKYSRKKEILVSAFAHALKNPKSPELVLIQGENIKNFVLRLPIPINRE